MLVAEAEFSSQYSESTTMRSWPGAALIPLTRSCALPVPLRAARNKLDAPLLLLLLLLFERDAAVQ